MRTSNVRAVLYHQSRPSYAAEITRFVQDKTGRDQFDVVADIGSGTGLSTQLFVPCAQQVIGVEPNDHMRQAAEPGPTITYVEGRAEATGLPSAHVDLLVAASCLEWCHPVHAAAEFRRILRADGFVVVLWNHRRITNPVSWEFDRLWLRHMGPRIGPDEAELDSIARRFLQPAPDTLRVTQHVPFDLQRLNDFALSSSYAPRPHQAHRLIALTNDLARFYQTHHQEAVALPFESVCYVGRIRDNELPAEASAIGSHAMRETCASGRTPAALAHQ